MGIVGSGRRQHDFGIRGHLDLAPPAVLIGDRDPAHLGVVFRRDHHFQQGCDRSVFPADLGPPLGEGRLIAVRRNAGGLIAGRPGFAALDIAQKHVAAPGIAGGVFFPAGDRHLVPSAVAGAGGGEHHRINPVRQQLRRGGGAVRRYRKALGGVGQRFRLRHRGHAFTQRSEGRHFVRHAFLQQQFGGLDHRLVVEPLAHRTAVHGVRDGNHGHALVMRHIGLDDGDLAAARQARLGVVQRLIPAVTTAAAEFGQQAEITHRLLRRHHRGKCCGVGGDHGFSAQPALEADAWDSEAGILIGQFEIPGVVGRFRHTPGHRPAGAKRHLLTNDFLAGLLQQTALRPAHHQRRHQILEHRARPGNQRGPVADRRHRPAQTEPVAGGQIALGDADKARQPRLGGQQVVVVGIQRAVADPIADRHQIALRVEQEAEGHRIEQLPRLGGDGGDPPAQRCGFLSRLFKRSDQRLMVRRGGNAQDRHRSPAQPRQIGEARRFDEQRSHFGIEIGSGRPRQQPIHAGLVAGDAKFQRGRPTRRLHDGGWLVAGRLPVYQRADGAGAFRQIAQPGGVRQRRRWPVRQGRCEQRQRVVHGSGVRIRCGLDLAFADQRRDITDAVGPNLSDQRIVQHFRTRVPEHHEMPGKIAAINRGDVFRLQRPQVLRAVPIVEMSQMTLHRAHRGKCGLQPVGGLDQADPAEVDRRDNRQQIQPKIGRRRAMRDHRRRIFLEIVRRQIVVGSRDKGLKEAPGAAGDQPQVLGILLVERRAERFRPRQADPARDQWGDQPQQQQRCGHQQMRRSQPSDQRCRHNRQPDAAGHVPIQASDIERRTGLHLGGGGPFQQIGAGHQQANHRAQDGIGHRPRLVGEKAHQQQRLRHRQPQIAQHRHRMHAHRQAELARDDHAHERDHRGQRDHSHDEQRPASGPDPRQHPSGQQRQHTRRRRQRAPQIVDHLPTADQRNRLFLPLGLGLAAEPQDPRQQLPVTPRPTVMSRCRDIVAGGEFVDDLDIGNQAGAGEDALHQIVAEQEIVGKPIDKRCLEGIDVVDAFAAIGAFAVQILVDIRNRGGIGVHAAGAGEHPLEQRALIVGRQRR